MYSSPTEKSGALIKLERTIEFALVSSLVKFFYPRQNNTTMCHDPLIFISFQS